MATSASAVVAWGGDCLALRQSLLPGEVQFILRTGYPKDYPAPASLRRPVEWLVYAG